MPDSFIDDEKLSVWKKLKLKIEDENTKKDIDKIWTEWARILNAKEKQEEKEKRPALDHSSSLHDLTGTEFVLFPSYTPSVASEPGLL